MLDECINYLAEHMFEATPGLVNIGSIVSDQKLLLISGLCSFIFEGKMSFGIFGLQVLARSWSRFPILEAAGPQWATAGKDLTLLFI